MNTRLASIVTTSLVIAACGGTNPPEGNTPIVAASTSTPVPVVSSSPPIASSSAPTTPPPPAKLTFKYADLPTATGDGSFDFIAYEPGKDRVWVPYARDAGYVDVYDIAKMTFSHLTGLPSKVVENKEKKKRTMGPSAAAIGDGVVYVGDRANSGVCAIDAATLKVGACFTLPAAPDCLAYVPSAKELWVTTPKTKTIAILDASKPGALKSKAKVTVDGAPEGFAVDDARGAFYTNLEDGDSTLRVDVKTRAVTTIGSPKCGKEGPRGLRVDGARSLLIVACTDHVQVLDGAKDGALLGQLDTGDGVDDIEYDATTKLVYVAAGKAARLTVAKLADDGTMSIVATGTTSTRVRNAVVDAKGNVYAIDPIALQLLVFAAP